MAAISDSEYTMSLPCMASHGRKEALLSLTIVWHSVLDRVGEQYFAPYGGEAIAVSRFAPLFVRPDGEQRPLGERCVARSPVLLQATDDGALKIVLPASSMRVQVDGVAVASETLIGPETLRTGALLRLGGGVLLCINQRTLLPTTNRIPLLVGVSESIELARRALCRAAGTDMQVLLRGETGTGKELAARAIHDLGRRAAEPFVAVNMAGLSDTLAAADLFGAAKGAYTGADSARHGYFGEAAGGTLFLDEIGDAPPEVQPMLLRVLENGEYHALGSSRQQVSRARLIAATDRELNSAKFNQPLLWRLEALVIRMPALRQRREDLGLLIVHFIRRWEAANGAAAALPIAFVGEMCAYDWPGNVRQLSNVVQRALLAASDTTPVLEELLGVPPAMPVVADAARRETPPRNRVKLGSISAQAVLRAMESAGWSVRAGALLLGVSRPSMYKLLEAHPQIRPATAFPPEELRVTLEGNGYDILRCASVLKTPGEALRRYALLHGLLVKERNKGAPG
ncbi:sigma-54-dependent Fis family transcriptional regulator [Massilia violaceinigra]|uniref:Sigma-54-dependent Fis family transcriptional regulator n=1 Tax=Massilia violaceinigra TaxID=2045208 RepID=A0ABY4A384_9BURK|nr:sigma 54-interacting transcriptional regulator [Massilia violaceinigra]UOD29128.1 sigma-54-dependent Fis family transcriptional regulator [Massilia violaceinigra]